jgi:hypothetical protein
MRHRMTLILGSLTLGLFATVAVARDSTLPKKSAHPGSACTEGSIRAAIQNRAFEYSDDTFFWSGRFEKPLIGKSVTLERLRKSDQSRQNSVVVDHPQVIAVSRSGDMAYEYGTGDMSFDARESGEHVAFQAGYVRVRKSVGGKCEVAASMFRPIESAETEKPK